MFGMLIEHQIVSNKDSSLIVTIHMNRSRDIDISYAYLLCICIGDIEPITSQKQYQPQLDINFSTRNGNNTQILTVPSNKITANKGTIAIGGLSIKMTTSLVSITKYCHRQRSKGLCYNPHPRALFRKLKGLCFIVRLMRSMHILSKHINCMSNIKMSNGEVIHRDIGQISPCSPSSLTVESIGLSIG